MGIGLKQVKNDYLFHITLFFNIYILEKKITLASSCPSQEIRLGGS